MFIFNLYYAQRMISSFDFSDDTEIIDLSEMMAIKLSPKLSNYRNLKVLFCVNNYLTSIPILSNLKELFCSNNRLTSIPILPNLEKLTCSQNRLTSIPILPNLKILFCSNNRLTSIPILPNLKKIFCSHNQLTTIPFLPKLEKLCCSHNQLIIISDLPNLKEIQMNYNPICDIITENNKYNTYPIYNFNNKNIILNKFRHLFYSLKYQKKFIKWLWGKSRLSKVQKIYHPDNLIKLIETNKNWDEEIDKW